MNYLQDSLQPLAERLGWALLHSLWQGAIVAALLAAALGRLRRHSAAARYAACLLAMLALLATTIVTAFRVEPERAQASAPAFAPEPTSGSTEGLPRSFAPDSPPDSVAAGAQAPGASIGGPAAQLSTILPLPPQSTAWSESLRPWIPTVASLWLAGVALLSLRHAAGWFRIRRWRRSGTETPTACAVAFSRLVERFGLRGGVWLRQSARVGVPMLTGVLRPIILLPAQMLTGMTPREIEAILAHELAHLARRDPWTNLAQILIETVLFYHPAVWWFARRARTEREHAADDLAVHYYGDRRLYAGALTRLAELECISPLALAATGGNLLARIRRIVLPPVREPAAANWTLPALAALCLGCAFLTFSSRADDSKSIVVKAGQPLQAAIDAAPAGSVLKLEAGEWKERIVITKPLTLEGAGWEKTTLAPDQHDPAATQRAAEMTKKSQGITDQAELKKLWATAQYEPTILVRGTAGVVIRSLKISGKLFDDRRPDQGIYPDPLVTFEQAKAGFHDCVLAGYYNGLVIPKGCEVEVDHCLMAGMWSHGAVVKTGGKLHMSESEVRNCFHVGIAIAPGDTASLIEKCRISGAAWHGIRYDDASPTIRGCTFFQIDRCGIYSSGKNQAIVKDNLFVAAGIWCLLGSDDTIEGNTFVGMENDAVGVSGGAKTRLLRNIFANTGTGISCTIVNGDDADARVPGAPQMEGNLFWNNKANFSIQQKTQPLPAGSIEADPKFVAVGDRNFTLAADSPARAAKAGAAAPLAPTGPWPLLAEEKAIIPEGETRSSRFWKGPDGTGPSKAAEDLSAKARATAKNWVADAFQLDDKTKREAAIERVRQAMDDNDENEARAGIMAFGQLGPIEFDKASFRPVVRRLIGSADVTTRVGAAQAFTMTGADPADLPRIFALADDPSAEMRSALTYIIVSLTKYDLTGKEATAAILKLMDKLPKDARDVAHALWGAKFSPEIEARVLAYCKDVDSEVGYNFFYGSLSVQANKSEASCRRLIEILAHPDTTNKAGRAAWGLQQGVAKEQYKLVADAMLRVIEARSDSSLRRNALRCLQAYGSAAQVEGVKALLAKPGVTGDFRKELETALTEIEKRP